MIHDIIKQSLFHVIDHRAVHLAHEPFEHLAMRNIRCFSRVDAVPDIADNIFKILRFAVGIVLIGGSSLQKSPAGDLEKIFLPAFL